MIIERDGEQYGRVTVEAPTASGKRRGWWKHVTGVDRSKKFGWCLEGEFLRDGEHDLPIGAVLVRSTPIGSTKWPKDSHTIWIVAADGCLTALHDGYDELCTWQQIGPTMLDRCTAALRYCPAVLEMLGEDRRRRAAARAAAEAERSEYQRAEAARAAKKAVDVAYPEDLSPLTEALVAMCILEPGTITPPLFSSQELALIIALRALPEDRLSVILDEVRSAR